MGAWSGLPFGNDEAQDFLFDYRQVDPGNRLAFLSDVLHECVSQEDTGDRAVAAVAILVQAAGLGDSISDDALNSADVEGFTSPEAARQLFPVAQQVLDLVLAKDSELRELWEDTGETEWFDSIEQLRSALSMFQG